MTSSRIWQSVPVAILLFLALLSFFLVCTVRLQRRQDINIATELTLIFLASWLTQLFRCRPLYEITGVLGRRWLKHLVIGIALGLVCVFVPAVFLAGTGNLHSTFVGPPSDFISWSAFYGAVACSEELLFRGLIFRNLRNGLGAWQAQALCTAAFVLAHLANSGIDESNLVLVTVSLVEASVLFGMLAVRTGSLAMSIGLHWAINWTQDSLLGLHVSGMYGGHGVFSSELAGPAWLVGGAFGLEASLPMCCVLMFGIVVVSSHFHSRTVPDPLLV